MCPVQESSPDPRYRMLLSIQYTEHGGVGHVEAIAVPTWRDRAVDELRRAPLTEVSPSWSEDDAPMESAVPAGPLSADEDVTLLFVPGARLILRFDDDVPPRR